MKKFDNSSMKIKCAVLGLFALICMSPNSLLSQVVADFTMDDSLVCTPQTVHFTNTGTTGPGYSYKWYFGGFGTSIQENPTYLFNSPGIYLVSFVITNNINPLDKDSTVHTIISTLTPSAGLTIDSTNACVRGKVNFIANFSTRDTARWDFGDGTSYSSYSYYESHIYTAQGTYPVTYITYYQECSDTSEYQIKVDGPIAEIQINPEEACKGTPIQFTMVPVSGVTLHEWTLGEGDTQTGNPATHSYETMGYNTILLFISGPSGNCEIEDTVHIFEVDARFTPSNTLCDQQLVVFNNSSTGNTENLWDFGNGNSSLSEDGSSIYNTGIYTVSLRIENSANCADSTEQEIVINDLPEVTIIEDPVICPGVPVQLFVSGADSASWFPPQEFDDPFILTPTVSPDSTTTYTALITDTATHCRNSDQVTVIVQPGFISGKIVVFPTDTTLRIGETFDVTIFDSLIRDLSYLWTPDTWISCTDCESPIFQPLTTTTYTLVISDTNQCYSSESFDITINVLEEIQIGVPKAFTPNGDQINDVIKVNGWGIKRLIEFRIFNRWGKEVFFSDDINTGWDGYFNDHLQNVDTYSYIIKAEMWDDNITTVKGTFSLLK
jgi:gliding motility-associated-like protein